MSKLKLIMFRTKKYYLQNSPRYPLWLSFKMNTREPNTLCSLSIRRTGWATVPALIMLTVIASITAGMASVSWTNVRSAQAMIGIAKAQSAAESGLSFASRRLLDEVNRFVIDKGVIDSSLAEKLWLGNWTPSDGQVTVYPASGYVVGSPTGSGIVHCLYDVYDQIDAHWIEVLPGDSLLPSLSNGDYVLDLKPIAIDDDEESFFRLKYELISNETRILITSVGEVGGISRTISMEFDLDKRVDYALVAMSRVMLGRNVMVEGPIGTRYGIINGELNASFGIPLVMRSDFYGIDPAILDGDISTLAGLMLSNDVDGDNRLRINHPTEGSGFGGSIIDYDGNQYVTEMDLFLSRYDSNGDIGVVYDASQAALAGFPGLSNEFTDDLQLAILIDHSRSDRNNDGVSDQKDRELGWDDGIIDARDHYAKISGNINFAVDVYDWETATGLSWQTDVVGPISPDYGQAASQFQLGEDILAELTTGMFTGAQSWFETQSQTGMSFGDTSSGQVASNIQTGGTYIPSSENAWEGVPWEADGAYDWYQRPTYRDMTFNNVRIPIGTNAVFENCMFIGVTWVETTQDVTDPNWNFAGAMEPDGSGGYDIQFEGLTADSGGVTYSSTREESNNIRFHECTFLGSIAGDVPSEFTHWRNKIQVTGESRFFIDPNDLDLAQQPDAVLLQAVLNSIDPSDLEQLARSSVLMPGWSVEIGAFQNNESVGVKLKGTIVSGLLDLRGVVDVHGSILSTYRPTEGEGPLFYGGEPDAFNTTIGYFGPEDGDGEGINDSMKPFSGYGRVSLRANPDAPMPDGVPWPITAVPDGTSYLEGS
ncbi:MAG: hypothetical protein QF718_05925 [Phycisphaerales bacterium]|nr:hypothetical protein [Phycisphaerales bacterium]